MIFYETDIFTEQIVEYIDDQSYSSLQAVLVADPEAGDLIPKTGGLRKIRRQGQAQWNTNHILPHMPQRDFHALCLR